MDNALSTLFSWQFLLFSLSVAALTWFIRTIVEYAFSTAQNSKLWQKLLLPIMPPIFGAVIALFATKYAYPDGLTSVSGRLMFGSVAGTFSGLVYQVIKGMLKDKIQTYHLNQQPQPPIPPNTNVNAIISVNTNTTAADVSSTAVNNVIPDNNQP